MRTDDAIKKWCNAGPAHFDVDRFRVGIGDQNNAAPVCVQSRQEVFCSRPGADQFPLAVLQRNDVQIQFASPEVCAVPIQRAAQFFHPGENPLPSGFWNQAVMLGVVIRNEFDPEMVIKPQIEQGAVEIQKYRFDLVPVDHKFSASVSTQQSAESIAASYSSVLT